MKKFTDWYNEVADFGLDRDPKKKIETPYDDPTPGHDIEYVTKQLARESFGHKYAIPNFYFGEVQWGDNPGALSMSFGPFGGLRAVVRKLEYDLQGEKVWVCKKVVEVKEKYIDHPDSLVQDLVEVLEHVDREEFDRPSADFDGTERLTLKLAHYLRKNTIQMILLYEGIKRVEENENYIIHFGCAGMGRQRQDQKRLDQFQIQVVYEQDRGILKVCGNELGDRLGKHRWILDPSQFCEYFMPNQPEETILDTILAHLNSY